MNVKDFKNYFEPEVFARGMELYKEGKVKNLKKTSFGYEGFVVSNDPRRVRIFLDNFDNIKDIDCTCPYDLGFCKHEAALLLAIKDYEDDSYEEIEKFIDRLSITDLRKIVKAQIVNDDNLLKNLKRKALYYFEDDDTIKKQIAEAALNENQLLLKELVFFLLDDKDFDARTFNNYIDIINILSDVSIKESVVISIIKSVESKLKREIKKALENEDDRVFNYIVETVNKDFEKISVSYYAVFYGENQECFNRLSKLYVDIIENSNDDFIISLAKQYLYVLYRQFASLDLQRELLQKYIDYGNFRKLLINSYIDSGEYEKALVLLNNESLFKEEAKRIYTATNNHEKIKDIYREEILSGDLTNYEKFRSMCENFSKELDSILKTLKNNKNLEATYGKILVREGRSLDLVEFCQKDYSRIVDCYCFIKGYDRQVEEMFVVYIKHLCLTARDTMDYRYICKVIKSYGEALGKEKSMQLVAKLTAANSDNYLFLRELINLTKGL